MVLDAEDLAETAGNPFWEFSLAIYGRSGVSDACLALQDRLELDVNLLLFCCWAGSRGHRLSAEELKRLLAVAGPWQEEVVRPLRAARCAVARVGNTAAFREKLKALELEAERLAQDKLHRTLSLVVGDGAPRPEAVAENLKAYLRSRSLSLDVPILADLAALMIGCCAELPALEAMRRLQ